VKRRASISGGRVLTKRFGNCFVFWESQGLPDGLVAALKILIVGVREQLINRRPPNTNISEWCKKDQCWSAVLEREFDLNLRARPSYDDGHERLTKNPVRAMPSFMKVTVYRPREAVGLGPPQAFLGDEHPTEGDWGQSAKAELSDDKNLEPHFRLHLTLQRDSRSTTFQAGR